MKIQHKKLGIDIEMPEILQGALDTFEAEIESALKHVNEHGFQLATFNGSLVKAAARVGWLPGLDPDGVDTMLPAKISFIADKVAEALREAREIPPQ